MKNEIEIASWTCHPTPFAGMHSFSCCTNSHKFHFKLSNCYNEIIDFHVIYDDMNNIFMEHPVDINYECNLKCISMHTFFPASCFSSSFRSRYTTMRKYIYVRRNFIFFFCSEPGERFATEFMLCECFYAKRILLPFGENKMKRARASAEEEKQFSARFVFEWIILKNMYLILYHERSFVRFIHQNMSAKLNEKKAAVGSELKANIVFRNSSRKQRNKNIS